MDQLVKTIASISDADFNALFSPLAERGAIVLFDDNSDKLDEGAKKTLLERWDDRRGARYFFVVSRASKTGSVEGNRSLSHRRANSVFFHLQESTAEAELDPGATLAVPEANARARRLFERRGWSLDAQLGEGEGRIAPEVRYRLGAG